MFSVFRTWPVDLLLLFLIHFSLKKGPLVVFFNRLCSHRLVAYQTKLCLVFFSALPIADWKVTVGDTSTTVMAVYWQNLAPLIYDRVVYYIAVINNIDGSLLNTVFVSGNGSFAKFLGLSSYTEYQVSVIAVKSDGQTYKSSNVTARTEGEGM